jgi:hypothetical protein
VSDSSALEANGSGRVTAGQLGRLSDYSRRARNGNIRMSIFAAFIGVLGIVLPGAKYMLIVPGFDFSIIAFSSVFFAIAGYLLVRGLFGTDPLSGDLRKPVVRRVDGPIGKHVRQYSRPVRTDFYIDAGGKRMQALPDDYYSVPAPATGRVYYLQRSHWFLSFDAPSEPAVRADRPERRNDGQLNQVILGKWTNGTMTLEFKPDGTAVGTLPGGGTQTGRWLVDSEGRLVGGFSGMEEAMDVGITDEGITLTLGGMEMKLTRSAG